MQEIIPLANANRKHLTMDPFAVVKKDPLFTQDSEQSRAFSVRIYNDDKDKFEEIGTVKRDYLVMENRELQSLAQEVADESNMQWREDRIFFNGKQYTYGIITNEIVTDVDKNDALAIGLLFQNSYDGTTKSRVQAYVNRLVCSNGMIAPMFFDAMSFKHDKKSEDWKDQVRTGLQYLKYAQKNLKEFGNICIRMNQTKINLDEMSNIRKNYLDSRIPSNLWGRIIDRYLEKERSENDTVWGFLNACTNVTWHENVSSQQYLGHNKYIMQQMLQWTAKETGLQISEDLRFVES